jgi:DnaJ-class molecular chaperone
VTTPDPAQPLLLLAPGERLCERCEGAGGWKLFCGEAYLRCDACRGRGIVTAPTGGADGKLGPG